MSWIPIRIDFVEPGTQCHRIANGRHHGFKTSTATILLDEDSGQEYPFGPVCAQHKVSDKTLLRGVPDFTTRDFTLEEGEGDHGSGGEGGGLQGADASDAEKARAFAKRYLMLRMDRVANIPGIQSGIRYAPLEKVYAEFLRTRELTDDASRHIIALERSEKTPVIYRSNHLLDVYTAYIQLNRRINEVKPGSYLDTLVSIRDNSLLKRLKLSEAQIRAAKLRLHPQAFTG